MIEVGQKIYVYSASLPLPISDPKEAVVTNVTNGNVRAKKVNVDRQSDMWFYNHLSHEEANIKNRFFWLHQPDEHKSIEIIKEYQVKKLKELDEEYARKRYKILDFLGDHNGN